MSVDEVAVDTNVHNDTVSAAEAMVVLPFG